MLGPDADIPDWAATATLFDGLDGCDGLPSQGIGRIVPPVKEQKGRGEKASYLGRLFSSPFLSLTRGEYRHRGLEPYFFTPTLICVNECAEKE